MIARRDYLSKTGLEADHMKKLPPCEPDDIIESTGNLSKEVANMYYTGIDLHKKTSFFTTVDKTGKVVARKNLLNDEKIILDYFATLEQQSRVVIEATASWYWLYDLLEAHGFDVVISNPLKTKAIASAKIKNDRVDSHMLAQLLRADLIPTVYVSPLELRQLKELIRHRQRLVSDAKRMKNRIHALLKKNQVVPFTNSILESFPLLPPAS